MNKHVFCTDLCLERGEPLEGLGDAPQRILMLAWPRGKWRMPRWESADLSQDLSRALHDAAQAGLHVALVDKVEAEGSLPTLHALPENVFADFSDEASLVAAIRNYVGGEVFEGTQDPRPTILCCTDSRKDACCARNGFATYRALVAIADPKRFNIVQATHLGGCRMAASLVVMPQRQRYGRMTAGLAPAFLATLERGEIYLPAYKGRSGQSEAMQVAELAVMRWAADKGRVLSEVSVLGQVPDNPEEGARLTVGAEVDGTRLAIELRAQMFMVQGNCNIVASGGGKPTLRWCLEAVRVETAA